MQQDNEDGTQKPHIRHLAARIGIHLHKSHLFTSRPRGRCLDTLSWWNAHNLDFLAAHTILNDGLIWLIDLAKLYKTFPRNNAKLLMLRMVPMLAFDNARLGDVHRNLPAIFCME